MWPTVPNAAVVYDASQATPFHVYDTPIELTYSSPTAGLFGKSIGGSAMNYPLTGAPNTCQPRRANSMNNSTVPPSMPTVAVNRAKCQRMPNTSQISISTQKI